MLRPQPFEEKNGSLVSVPRRRGWKRLSGVFVWCRSNCSFPKQYFWPIFLFLYSAVCWGMHYFSQNRMEFVGLTCGYFCFFFTSDRTDTSSDRGVWLHQSKRQIIVCVWLSPKWDWSASRVSISLVIDSTAVEQLSELYWKLCTGSDMTFWAQQRTCSLKSQPPTNLCVCIRKSKKTNAYVSKHGVQLYWCLCRNSSGVGEFFLNVLPCVISVDFKLYTLSLISQVSVSVLTQHWSFSV